MAIYDDSTVNEDQCQVSTREFLNHLFANIPGNVFFELTYILPDELKYVGPSPITESFQLGREMPDWNHIADLNAQGYGVYYALTPKHQRTKPGSRGKETDAAYCQVLWVDVDLKAGYYSNKADIHYALCDAIIPPTVIIDSGGGLHGLWRIGPIQVTKTTLPHLKHTLRGLALALHADTACAELARVFRLPGTVNTKPERNGAVCTITDWLPGQCHYEDFDDYRLLAAPAERKLNREFSRHRPDDLPKYVTWYLDNMHADGTRNSTLNWTAYKMHSDGYSQAEAEQILKGHAIDNGLPENEVLATIASAYRAAPGDPGYLSKGNRVRMAAGDAVKRLLGGAK